MIKQASDLLDLLAEPFHGNQTQQKALSQLRTIGLPDRKSEAYKFTPITTQLTKKIDFTKTSQVHFNEDLLYPEEGSHLVFINGKLNKSHSKIRADLNLEIGQVTEGKNDPFSLLNTAFAKEEIVIKSGGSLPVFVYHLHTHGINNPRIKVEVGDGDSIQVIEKLITAVNHSTFTNSYMEFKVGRNAVAHHTKVQNYNPVTYSHETVIANVNRDGKFYDNTFSFEGALLRNNLTINLESENCEGHMYGLFLLDKQSHVDNNTSVDHLQPNSYSNELYKGILDEKATGVFNGKIYVRQDAQKTNAFQSNNNILLSDDATLHTKPQLEIWADDVKCSHGCTSGQLDEEAIFYLRARGIDKKSAKAMILNAFSQETLAQVWVESVKEEVQKLIDQKLA